MSDTSAGIDLSRRHGNCYPLAYRYVEPLPDDGVRLVHGVLDGRVEHAWIVEADGWVWEPTNDAWFHDEEAFAESFFKGQPTRSFEPEAARQLRRSGEPIGVWLPEDESEPEDDR